MTRIMTWKKAYTISLAVHVVVAAVFVLLCAGAVIHHEPKMVVINLDSSEPQSQGSGHAGGGGGGSAGQTLFPDKLSAADMEKRVEAVTENQSASPDSCCRTGCDTGSRRAAAGCSSAGCSTGSTFCASCRRRKRGGFSCRRQQWQRRRNGKRHGNR